MIDPAERLTIADLVCENARRLSQDERLRILTALQWYSMTEFCDLTGYSVRAIRNFIDQGMPAYQGTARGAYRFDQSAIEWMRDNAARAA